MGPTRKSLRCHSLFVKTASPVLRAMLGPNFSEGHRPQIDLPEDDADKLELINVVHNRAHSVPGTLSADQLMHLAVTSDKYDCWDSLTFALRIWLGNVWDVTKFNNIVAYALVAYLAGPPKPFAEATAALVFKYAGSYRKLLRKYEEKIDAVELMNLAHMSFHGRVFLRELLDTYN